MKNIDRSSGNSLNQRWVVFDRYRSALLSQKYYGNRLARIQSLNTAVEIVIAIGTATSTIGGWAIWKLQLGALSVGAVTWAVLSGAATVLAIIKPLLNWGETIKRYGRLYGGYTTLAERLRVIVDDMSASGSLSSDIVARFNRLIQGFTELAPLEDPDPDRKLIKKLEDEVNRQTPPERFRQSNDATVS